MKNECPECFGRSSCPAGQETRRQCEYAESCALYAQAGAAEKAQDAAARHLIHIEAGGYAVDEAALTYAAAQNEGLPQYVVSLRGLASFLKYLLSLDDLTLGVIQEVTRRQQTTIKEIADAAGLSRQAVHWKIMDVIRHRPELSVLFIALMPKLSAARKRFLRRKVNDKKGEMEK